MTFKFSEYARMMKGLDIETTGLDPAKGRVYSIGITGQEEVLVNQGASKDWKTDSIFQKKQIERGAFASYDEAVARGTAVSEQDAVSTLMKSMKPKDVFLIQNLNFENRHISHMFNELEQQGLVSKGQLQDLLEYTQADRAERYFYGPPEVKKARDMRQHAWNDLLTKYRESKNSITPQLEKYVEESGKTMAAYRESFLNPNRQGAVFADMMDFTKHLYATATLKGHMTGEALTNNFTNIELLARTLGYGEESHQALKDATMQMDIFEKIAKMTEEVESGKVSMGTKYTLGKLDFAIKKAGKERLYSSIVRGLEETKESMGYKDAQSLKKNIVDVDVHSKSKGMMTIQSASYETLNPHKYTKDPVKALEHILSRAGPNIPSQHLDEARELASQFTDVDKMIGAFSEKHELLKAELNASIDSYKPISKTHIFDKVTKTAQNIGSYVMANKGKSALLAAGLLGLAAFATTGKEPEKQERRPVPDDVFKQYRRLPRPTVYHGSGFYDFENRTGHHKA